MMKSLAAIATLAAMTMAKRSRMPKLIVDYDFSEDGEDEKNKIDVLALYPGAPATIKYPKDKRSRGADPACGWNLTQTTEDFDSFNFVVDDSRCKKIEFTVDESFAEDYEVEELNFTNDCGDGDETWTIMVQVIEDNDEL